MAPRHQSLSVLALALIASLVASQALVAAHSHTWETRTRVKRSNIVTSASELAGKSFDYGTSRLFGLQPRRVLLRVPQAGVPGADDSLGLSYRRRWPFW